MKMLSRLDRKSKLMKNQLLKTPHRENLQDEDELFEIEFGCVALNYNR